MTELFLIDGVCSGSDSKETKRGLCGFDCCKLETELQGFVAV